MRLGAIVERHFWMVTVVVVMMCSSMTASAVAHIIEATILREGSEPIRRSPASWPALQPSQVASEVARSGARLVQRNIFCSRCVFQLPGSNGALVAADTDDPPLTDLPLRLIATTITPVKAGSFVTVRNTSTAYQGAFRLGETIPGAGMVTRILATCVDFENAISRRIERISLLTPRPATPGPRAPPARKRSGDRRSPRGTRAELLAAIDDGVRRVDADSFEIDGALELRSVEKALEVYSRVRNANWLSLTITRRGKLLSLDYTVRR
jgi:hypothetical protein